MRFTHSFEKDVTKKVIYSLSPHYAPAHEYIEIDHYNFPIFIMVYFWFQETFVSDFQSDNKERLNTMYKTCRENGLDKEGKDQLHQPKGWEYFIADYKGTKLVLCNIFCKGILPF